MVILVCMEVIDLTLISGNALLIFSMSLCTVYCSYMIQIKLLYWIIIKICQRITFFINSTFAWIFGIFCLILTAFHPTIIIFDSYKYFNMNQAQLIIITHQDYHKYRQLEKKEPELTLQIQELKSKLQETTRTHQIIKKLTQENNQFKGKIRILSKQTIRLARLTLKKDDIIAQLSQQLNKISQKAQQSITVEFQQEQKQIKQRAVFRQNIEIQLRQTKQELHLLRQKNVNDLVKLQEKWREAQEEIKRCSEMNISLKNGINTLKKALQIKIKEMNQLRKNYDLLEKEKQGMKKQYDQLNLKYSQKLLQIQQYVAQQQAQLKTKIQDFQAEYRKLNKQLEDKLAETNKLLTQQSQKTKQLQEQLKQANDEMKSSAGQIMIYRNQVSKLERLRPKMQTKIEKLIQQNTKIKKEKNDIMDQLQTWKLLAEEAQSMSWQNLLKNSSFQTELRSKKKVYEYCRQLLYKHLQYAKLCIYQEQSFVQNDDTILKKFIQKIQKVLQQWQKHINIQSFKHLL